MFTATTISYDGFDNCYLFLMTLPVTRKKYVNEKYLFKFNAEKARYANLIAMGCILAVVDIVYQIGKMFPAEMRSNIIDYLNGTGAAGFILICGAVAVAAGVISYLSSRHIMARKEF